MRTCVYKDYHQRERCTECGEHISICPCEDPDDLARDRLETAEGKVLNLVRSEIRQSREEFPSNHYQLTALSVEVGELAAAIMEHSLTGRVPAADVLKRAIRVASISIRLGIEGDQDFTYEPATVFPDEFNLP